MKSVLLAVGAMSLALAGCQTASQEPKMVWARIDGQSIRGNPKLEQQGEIDRTICLGETQKSAVGMAPIYYRGIAGAINAQMIESQRSSALLDVAKGCMAQRGYILVPEAEAEARQLTAQSRAKTRS